jgi:uncharacterized protein (DUF362 family)
MDKTIDRRCFLKGMAFSALGSSLTPLVDLPKALAKTQKVDIIAVRGERTSAVEAAIDGLGGMGAFVKKGQRVLLKPNMSFPNPPEMGTTTHPEVVATMARLCMEAGASRVLVLDYPLRSPRLTLRRSGISEACKPIKKVHVAAISEKRFFRKVEVPKGKAIREVEVMKELGSADVLINLPVAKSHSQTSVSLGLKNLMGLIWDRYYFHQFINLNQGIADLASVIKPNLVVVDASRALLTAGPSGPGRVRELRTIVAGKDPVAVDAYTVGLTPWYGQSFSGKEVGHIIKAHKMGLGQIDLRKVSVKEIGQ